MPLERSNAVLDLSDPAIILGPVIVTQFLVFIPITCLLVYIFELKRCLYLHAPSDPSLPTPIFIRPQGYPDPDLKKPVPQIQVWVLSGQGWGRPPMTQGLPLTIPMSTSFHPQTDGALEHAI